MIELKNLDKSFAQLAALKNINLFIQEGEIFGIIGKSGAGKSTLLRCMNLLERPDSGQVIIDNQDITNFPAARLNNARHKIGMIFQHFNLLSCKTVYDNIALPSRIQGISEETIRQKINDLLPLVGLAQKELAYPHELSGGQKQRVAIARALSYSPKILLCDEATSALDPHTTESILELLKTINLQYGITIVMITHEMNVVKKICHRLAVMEQGEIIEMNALANIFEDESSQARHLLFEQLNPKLPDCLTSQITPIANERALLKIIFQGKTATVPFISQTSRELMVDINILLANIDRFDTVTCGVLVIELTASPLLLEEFIMRCKKANLIVEILGYVNGSEL